MEDQHTNTLVEVQQLLELDVRTLETLEQCSEALGQVSAAADEYAGKAVTLGKFAIQYALKGGHICLRAKEIAPHGEFEAWLDKQAELYARSRTTIRRWMVLAKKSLMTDLLADPDIKGLQDAYIATGMLPEPEPKPTIEVGGESDKVKLAWSPIKFSTRIDDWTKEQALDWLYEYDRMSQWARQLRMEFGLA